MAVLTLVFTLPSRVTPNRTLSKFKNDHHLTLPKFAGGMPSANKLNPFAPSAHPPPVQANSTNGDSKWYQSLGWLSPFSSSITLDEDRSVLPPLVERPPIYTYYDGKADTDKAVKKARNAVLLTWRRAWWAKGFKPVVLGPLEAKKSSRYEEVLKLDTSPETKSELVSWLAWESMGGGVLASYMVFPMGRHEDPVLENLRQSRKSGLIRYEGLKGGLYTSNGKAEVTLAILTAIAAGGKQSFYELDSEVFSVQPTPTSIAYYSKEVIAAKYATVAKEMETSQAKGLLSLARLINGHLHNTWQEGFSKGIVVLKPIRNHMTAILEPAAHLAELLAQCPDSPMLSACPPNNKACKPCVASQPLKMKTFPHWRNDTLMYTIGVVLHPWTTATMEAFRSDMNIRYIRRETERDRWLRVVTQISMGTGVSTPPRLSQLKNAIASSSGAAHSVWFAAERELPKDLEWHFGFALPKNSTDTGKSETPVPGPERRPPPPPRDFLDGPLPTEAELEEERQLFEGAKVMGKTEKENRVLKATEAWNLADTEAWRFVKAFMARQEMVRRSWEDEERKLTGGAGNEEVAGWF